MTRSIEDTTGKIAEPEPHRRTYSESVQAIRQAIEKGANTVDEIAQIVGLKPATVYQYGIVTEIQEILRKKGQRVQKVREIIASGEKSLEQICKLADIAPQSLWRLCEQNDIQLPPDLITWKYRPKMDALIEKGATLQEIGAAENLVRERARQYINYSGQHKYWIERKQEAENALKIEEQQKNQFLERLLYILKVRMAELYQKEDWAHQMAANYLMSLKINTPHSHKLPQLIKFFQRYEKAVNSDKPLSLERLSKGLVSHTNAGRILHSVGLEPLYGSRYKTPQHVKDAIKASYQLKMPYTDIAYFIGVPVHIVSKYQSDRRSNPQNKKYIINLGNKGSFTYRLASQVYEAQSLGIGRTKDIAELLGTAPEIVKYAINNKNKIVPKIITALRMVYANPDYDKPYKTSAKV